MGKGNRIEANYTEDAVALAIQTILTIASFPFFRYSIELFSRSKERWLGADARLNSRIAGFKPFYLQFKRPSAFTENSNSKIAKDRRTKEFDSNPSLFFKLREKQKNHREFQHNILHNLRSRVTRIGSDAVYVCPLFLDREAYQFNIRTSGMRQWLRFWTPHPFDFEDRFLDLNNGTHIPFGRVPIINEHISIPPHGLVTNAKHSYSFNEHGHQVLFHSPEEVMDSSLLGDHLKRLSKGSLKGEKLIKPENSLKELKDLVQSEGNTNNKESLPIPEGLFEIKDGLKAWAVWGNFLREEFNIWQFAIKVHDLP